MIDAFRIGVLINMHGNHAGVLGTMIRQLGMANTAAGKLQGTLTGVGKAVVGVGMIFAGGAIIKGLIEATKHAEKLNHELVKLQTGARLSDVQTSFIERDAFRLSRQIPGANVADLVKQRRELFGVLGSMDHANAAAPLVAEGSLAVGAYTDKSVDLAQIAVKAIENRGQIGKDGKIDPAVFAREFNSLVRAIVASEGLVTQEGLLQFIKQAGPAARMMTPEAMWGMAPALMNAMGNSKAGTATMSLFQQMIGHVVAGQRVAIAMEHAGMLTHGKWRVERGGKVRMDQDAVPDQAGFMADPFTWLHDHLQAMRSMKGADGKPIDMLGIVQEIFQLSSRQTTARLISDIDTNWPTILAEKQRFDRMPDAHSIRSEQNEKDASVNVHNLAEAWDNFATALGKPGIPIAIGVLQKLTIALNFLQEAIIRHPNAAADMFYLSGAIGSLLMLRGAMIIFRLAFAPFVTGIRMLVGIAGLAATGEALSVVAGGLAKLAGPIGLLYGILHSSSTQSPEADRAPYGGKSLHERFPNLVAPDNMPLGPVHKESFVPSGGGSPRIQTITYIQLDKRTIATAVSEEQGRALSLPSPGSSRFDPRMTPSFPSDTLRV